MEWAMYGSVREAFWHERGRSVGYSWKCAQRACLVTPLPDSAPGELRLRRINELELSLIKQVLALDADGHALKTVKLEEDRGYLKLQHERGVFAYRIEFLAPKPAH